MKVLWDALTLNTNFYEDAHENPQAVKIAQLVVFLAAIAHALGSILIPLLAQVSLPLLLLIFVINGLMVVVGYYFWTYTIWKMGKWWRLPLPTYRELLSPIGFAHAPQIFNFLTVVPLLGRPIEIVLATWSLLATIVAVNQGLNIKLRWAILICVIGWLLVEIAVGVVQIMVQWLII
ncbi:MAG: hypothetical protein EA343_14275 [Nodularia sp. (in: Bacteria)]|nr:MAG: hypothetical protein EA343_14275 [Nodularia sp. (in: cyanobacteria)]